LLLRDNNNRNVPNYIRIRVGVRVRVRVRG
jgi:hypothetical protein